MKVLILEIAFSAICISVFGQDLKPDELMALGGRPVAGIDSVMAAKGFIKQTLSEGDSYSICSYTYESDSGTAPVRRSLHLGLKRSQNMLQLAYGVWQKDEAAAFIQILLKEGFKKTVQEMPDIDRPTKVEFVGYRRGADYFAYQEMNQGSSLYVFTIGNDHYKP